MIVERAGAVLALTLNRPDKRNALDTPTLDRLAGALVQAEGDAGVRVVTLSGAGRDFCAGADLGELLASADRPIEENERSALDLGEIFLSMRRLSKPVVALVRGRALAGGAGLALACDLVLASDQAHFGFPEIRRGFVPAMVMTLLRRAAGEKIAFELVATGRQITAADAFEAGLVSRVIDDARFDGDAAVIVEQLAEAAPAAFGLTKQLFYELDVLGIQDGILLGARINALARNTDEFRRTVSEFLQR